MSVSSSTGRSDQFPIALLKSDKNVTGNLRDCPSQDDIPASHLTIFTPITCFARMCDDLRPGVQIDATGRTNTRIINVQRNIRSDIMFLTHVLVERLCTQKSTFTPKGASKSCPGDLRTHLVCFLAIEGRGHHAVLAHELFPGFWKIAPKRVPRRSPDAWARKLSQRPAEKFMKNTEIINDLRCPRHQALVFVIAPERKECKQRLRAIPHETPKVEQSIEAISNRFLTSRPVMHHSWPHRVQSAIRLATCM